MAEGFGSLPDPEKLLSNHRGPFPFLQYNILTIFAKNKDKFIKANKLHKTLGNKDLSKALKRLNKKLQKVGLKVTRHNVYLLEETKPKYKDKQMGLFQ